MASPTFAELAPTSRPSPIDAFAAKTNHVAHASTRALAPLLTLLIVLFSAGPAWGAPDGSPDPLLARPIALIIALALVSLAPFVFMTLTAFLKISTVLHIVRGAIGAQNIPSNTVVMALAAALTLIAMAPVGTRIMQRAAPGLADSDSANTATLFRGLVDATKEPLRAFLRANASPMEHGRFYEVARAARPPQGRDDVARDDFIVLIPAFMITELMEAFALGFVLYLPFLVIDLVIANVLLSLGMQMLNPTQVSLPFKLLLFVAIDGWGLLARALVTGYAVG